MIIHDVTLRDGNHACGHSIRPEFAAEYAKAAEDAGLQEIEVGHGNGLGASSVQVGKSEWHDRTVIENVRHVLTKAKLCVLAIPGFASRDDVVRAIKSGADQVRVGCHCTEADTTRRYIEQVVSLGKEAVGVLMMAHRQTPEQMWLASGQMMGYGAKRVIIMDSAGVFLPVDVNDRLPPGFRYPDMHGFHAHNNLGMAVANSLTAAHCGAGVIDASAKGLGAGAGNAPLEQLVAAFEKAGVPTGLDLNKVIGLATMIENQFGSHLQVDEDHLPKQDGSSVLSGLYGVFSGFKPHVIGAAALTGVDERLIWKALGARGAVAGQEDLVVKVAQEIKESKREDI